MDDLEKKGAFKFPEIAEGLESLKHQQVIGNTKLCRIVKLMEKQQKSDNERHNINKRISIVAMLIAAAALYIAAVETGVYERVLMSLNGLIN